MTEENLKNIKENYKKSLVAKNMIKELRKRETELEETSKEVQEYLDIKLKINSLNMYGIGDHSDTYLLDEAIFNEKIENYNNIYIYAGTYRHDKSDNVKSNSQQDILTNYFDPSADYHKYINIEEGYQKGQVKIPVDQSLIFEKDNIVLHQDKEDFSIFYKKIRNMFFETCIREGQEKAIEKVLKMRDNK